jgi:tRNA-Thr(GGU) m(6)t(6)A37 methyltransferase TsaA
LQKITLEAIGEVRNSIHKKKREGWESIISEVVLDPKYEEALDGVKDYSHLLILFWLSRIPPRVRGRMLKIHPRARLDLPLVGIFSTRTQYRPNPIGLTLVQLLRRKKNILEVRGLDALDGTPVLDIKPISPRTEFPRKTRVPEWYHRLWLKPKRRSSSSQIKKRKAHRTERNAQV